MTTIGEMAKAANVNVETIRYYQRRGLLPEPAKPFGGHRRYSAQDVSRLRFIKRAQLLGFSLEEIDNLLRLEKGGSCGETHDLAMHKLALINAKIADLRRMQRVLKNLAYQCETGNQSGECPIIQSLTHGLELP